MVKQNVTTLLYELNGWLYKKLGTLSYMNCLIVW